MPVNVRSTSGKRARSVPRKVDFEAVFNATYEAIFGYAVRRCSSPHDAADVVAETLAIAWRRVDGSTKERSLT
jgi:DNA-directed RNA polymerase specialized sigma24 family protein